MMTLAEWETAINAEPANALLRLVFADWLQDSGDPELVALADGMRAFAECGRVPHHTTYDVYFWWWSGSARPKSSWVGKKANKLSGASDSDPKQVGSAFAAFMFAAREWPNLDQVEFYREFGPKVEAAA